MFLFYSLLETQMGVKDKDCSLELFPVSLFFSLLFLYNYVLVLDHIKVQERNLQKINEQERKHNILLGSSSIQEPSIQGRGTNSPSLIHYVTFNQRYTLKTSQNTINSFIHTSFELNLTQKPHNSQPLSKTREIQTQGDKISENL